jgi:hypothetical protein
MGVLNPSFLHSYLQFVWSDNYERTLAKDFTEKALQATQFRLACRLLFTHCSHLALTLFFA